jgi:uncharacterized protein YxeA
MKKIFICLIAIFIIILSIVFNWYTNNVQASKEIATFNSTLEQFTKANITGVEVTTVINKALDNNEQYNIKKNSDNIYESDEKYSLKIYVKLTEDGEYFPMEALEQIGISGFTKAYSSAIFKTTKTEKNENGRISKIYFEIVN